MYTILKNGKIANESGEIAVRMRQATQKTIRVGSNEYTFTVRSNVSLAWVKPKDVDKLLSMTITCCNGRQSLFTFLPDEVHVKRWLGVSIW